MEQLIELLQQIQDLAGVGIEALNNAGKGGEGEAAPQGAPGEAAPSENGGEQPPFER